MSLITAECSSCKKKFKTLYSLKKHTTQRHNEVDDDLILPVFMDSAGNEIELPQARDTLDAESKQGYKMWLSGLVERLNSTFHPRLPGKVKNNACNVTVIMITHNFHNCDLCKFAWNVSVNNSRTVCRTNPRLKIPFLFSL